jgi:ribosomal protein S18 acetylase RimI-like enzyme
MLNIQEMTIEDYPEALALWQLTPGMGLSSADEQPAIDRFLQRNPGLCFAAREDGHLVGTALCGHDGRRGYIYHVAVADAHRTRGIARTLVERSLDGLRQQGIRKAHLMVYEDNLGGIAFWHRLGWYRRDELALMSMDLK